MSEEHDYVAKLEISPHVVNVEAAMKEASDLAWEHAKEFASHLGHGIGTDEFVEIYRTLDERYGHQVEHLKLFMLTALMTVREILQGNLAALPIEHDDKITEEEAVGYITELAQCLVGSYMWLSASHELFWPEDEAIPEDTAVTFYFNTDDIEMED